MWKEDALADSSLFLVERAVAHRSADLNLPRALLLQGHVITM